MNKNERAMWEELPDVFVRLPKDELGYPPKEWEQLKCEPTGNRGIYKIKSIPFYARGLAWDDEIATITSPEGYSPVFASVVKRSGFSTMRLSISDSENRDELINYFTSRGVFLEFDNLLVALAISSDVFEQISEFVCDQKDKGRWDAEDGYLAGDNV